LELAVSEFKLLAEKVRKRTPLRMCLENMRRGGNVLGVGDKDFKKRFVLS
jgi:hypothetical protein